MNTKQNGKGKAADIKPPMTGTAPDEKAKKKFVKGAFNKFAKAIVN